MLQPWRYAQQITYSLQSLLSIYLQMMLGLKPPREREQDSDVIPRSDFIYNLPIRAENVLHVVEVDILSHPTYYASAYL